MRPQQTGSVGICTVHPAASSTPTAACPMCGWKWLVNVSGQSNTVPRGPAFVPPRRIHHCCNVSSANSGISRSSRPAPLVAKARRAGMCESTLSTFADFVRATAAATIGSQPSA